MKSTFQKPDATYPHGSIYSTNRGYQDSLHGRFGLGERILAAAQERVGLLRQFALQIALLSTVKLFSAANYTPHEKQILKWH